MSFDGDGEYADVWRQTTRRARKEHACSACHQTIERGHLYVEHVIIGGGDVDNLKRCARCDAAIYQHLMALSSERREARRRGGLGDFDDFDQPMPALNCGHTYKEVHGVEPPEHIARLAFMTQDEMQREMEKRA